MLVLHVTQMLDLGTMRYWCLMVGFFLQNVTRERGWRSKEARRGEANMSQGKIGDEVIVSLVKIWGFWLLGDQ